MDMMLNPKKYFEKYDILINEAENINKLKEIYQLLAEAKKHEKRVFFAGNGASSAISSHAALDFTKQGKLTAYTASDPALISAYSNDYGYSNALLEIFRSYREPDDLLVLTSTSGNSENIVNLANYSRSQGHTVISLTGRNADNNLKLNSDIGLWVDSHAYNIVENVHMIWLGFLIDSLVGREVYDVS